MEGKTRAKAEKGIDSANISAIPNFVADEEEELNPSSEIAL